MAITNVDELREFLSKEMEKVSSGESTPANANAQANLAGKIIQSVKIELDYNKMVGANPSIKFLGEKLGRHKALTGDNTENIQK
jgi:hypothetical protein